MAFAQVTVEPGGVVRGKFRRRRRGTVIDAPFLAGAAINLSRCCRQVERDIGIGTAQRDRDAGDWQAQRERPDLDARAALVGKAAQTAFVRRTGILRLRPGTVVPQAASEGTRDTTGLPGAGKTSWLLQFLHATQRLLGNAVQAY